MTSNDDAVKTPMNKWRWLERRFHTTLTAQYNFDCVRLKDTADLKREEKPDSTLLENMELHTQVSCHY